METHHFTQAASRLKEGFKIDFLRIANAGGFGIYAETLYQELSQTEPDYRLLLNYGFKNLPSEHGRPDKNLAAFFLTLSEITGIPDDVRDLAIDTMVYCENDDDTFSPGGMQELIRRKEKILPTETGQE